MPRKAFSENHTSWDLLNTRIKERAAELPHLQPQRTELEAAMARAMALKVEHRNLTGETLRVARELREAVAHASKLESRLRSLLKGTMGDTSEQLFEFGVHPRRHAAKSGRKPRSPLAAERAESEPCRHDPGLFFPFRESNARAHVLVRSLQNRE